VLKKTRNIFTLLVIVFSSLHTLLSRHVSHWARATSSVAHTASHYFRSLPKGLLQLVG